MILVGLKRSFGIPKDVKEYTEILSDIKHFISLKILNILIFKATALARSDGNCERMKDFLFLAETFKLKRTQCLSTITS